MTSPTPTSELTRLQRVKQGDIQTLPTQEEHRVVSIDRLVENPDNERKTFRNMEGLVATVKSSGILEPLIVERHTDGKLLVKMGARRLRAAKAAGLTKVPVIISQPENSAIRRRKSLISNLQREDIGPVEMAEGLQALLDEDDEIATQNDLAQAIGKPKSWVSDMLRILTLPPKLQAQVRTSELSVPHDAVIKIARLENQSHQQRLVKALLNGATARDIRQEVNNLKGKASEQPPRKPKAVYSTAHDATVIVQSKVETLNREQKIAALTEALKQAKGER